MSARDRVDLPPLIGSTMQRISSNVVSLNHDIIYLYSVVRELKLMETRKKIGC